MKGNYVYANARAKALEPKLIRYEQFLKMAECNTAEEGLKILSEAGFGDGETVQSVIDFENLIEAEKRKFFSFVEEVSPSESFKKYLLTPADYQNAQAFIRAKYLKTDVAKMLTADGLIKKDKLKDKIMTDDYDGLSEQLASALLECDNLFVEKKATGSIVDGIFKKNLYAELEIYSSANSDLKKIFSRSADAVNIAQALRIRDYKTFLKSKVSGGKIEDKIFELLSEGEEETIINAVDRTEMKEEIIFGVEDYFGGKPLFRLEKAADDYPLEFFKKTLYDTSSMKPFMLYCFYMLNQFTNVRIAMVGLINGFEKSEIKERLRLSYAG